MALPKKHPPPPYFPRSLLTKTRLHIAVMMIWSNGDGKRVSLILLTKYLRHIHNKRKGENVSNLEDVRETPKKRQLQKQYTPAVPSPPAV
jgi:hypothetical protein